MEVKLPSGRIAVLTEPSARTNQRYTTEQARLGVKAQQLTNGGDLTDAASFTRGLNADTVDAAMEVNNDLTALLLMTFVESVDGRPPVVDELLDLPMSDWNALVTECQGFVGELTNPKA